jgi:hypothetical protein
MKKLFVFALAVILLGVTASCLFAEGTYTRASDFNLKIEVIGGNNTGYKAASSVAAGDYVFGWSATNSTAVGMGLYDNATSVSTSSERIGEVYVAAGTVSEQMFPFPYKVQRGITVAATENSTVTVYYEDRSL